MQETQNTFSFPPTGRDPEAAKEKLKNSAVVGPLQPLVTEILIRKGPWVPGQNVSPTQKLHIPLRAQRVPSSPSKTKYCCTEPDMHSIKHHCTEADTHSTKYHCTKTDTQSTKYHCTEPDTASNITAQNQTRTAPNTTAQEQKCTVR